VCDYAGFWEAVAVVTWHIWEASYVWWHSVASKDLFCRVRSRCKQKNFKNSMFFAKKSTWRRDYFSEQREV